MAEYIHNINLSNKGTRNEVRKRLVDIFCNEQPGTGAGDLASRNTYYVETLQLGNRIFLRRPAWLKKGFDFVIHVENIDFGLGQERRIRTNPKHDDLYVDLEDKKRTEQKKYKQLYNLIEQIYNCKDVPPSSYSNLNFKTGYPVDLILLTYKWFFIEQDIRDWSYSGREMCFNGIPK